MNLTYLSWCIATSLFHRDISWVDAGLWAKKLTFSSTTNELTLFPFEWWTVL